MMKQNTITEASIECLVDRFYAKVRGDADLAPVFNAAIGTEDDSWAKHLRILYDFWSSLMLRSGRYRGNPHQKHRELPPFNPKLFDRWLELFAETARELHTEEVANTYIARSRRIAESLKLSVSLGEKPLKVRQV